MKGRLRKVMGLSGDHPVGVGVAQTHGSVSCNQGEWKLDKVLGLSGSQLKQP